jgi:hypothetical protein
MPESTPAFFDPKTIAMLREVLDDAWSLLPAGRTGVSRYVGRAHLGGSQSRRT